MNLDAERTALQNQEGKLDPKPTPANKYTPNKRNRSIRRQVYERFYWLRDDPLRVEAEAEWETADKEYSMYIAPQDTDDWRANIQLPDVFAAIHSDLQETIERKSRPSLTPTEESDEPLSEFCNSVINYNMNNTGYDYQFYLAKLARNIRGTSFLMNYWRTDKRVVKDPTGVKDGEVQYQDKEITDFDDDYTEWVPNEFIYLDEKAKSVDEAVDMFRREVINIEEFHRIYGNRPGFVDTEYVYAGGDTSNRSIFRLPQDIMTQDVEVLHYYNRGIDAYWVVANNVTIHDSPLPSKHKELPIAAMHLYRVPGRFWSMGFPKILHVLSEERKSLRNLNLDRQKINIAGAFLHNNSYDLDDEDTTLRPGGIISVDTNGQPLANAIERVDMGDVPSSYFKTEEILLDDITRATGINPLAEAQATGGTATQAAILKENTLKRINYLATLAELDCVVRIGRLKWSNIQFFYPHPRMESIYQDNEEKKNKVYRNITTQNQKFQIVDDNGSKSLSMQAVRGATALQLKPEFAKYLEGNVDISVDADIYTPPSKAIEQTKKTEIFSLMLSNPATMAVLDINASSADILEVNNIKADKWLKNPYGTKDTQMLAESENLVMSAGQPLAGTEGATEEHTIVHLMFTKTQDFMALPHEIQQIIMDHILQEHDSNPATGSSADLMGAYGLAPEAPGAPGAGAALPPPSIQANTSQPQAQIADVQPTNFSQPE